MGKSLSLIFALLFIGTASAVPILIADYSQVTPRIANITQTEYNTLVSFFFSTNGLEWTNNTNWLQQSVSPCFWFGVICNSGGNHITSLSLPFNNLTGVINPDIGGLFDLDFFDISGNQVSGPIPSSFASCLSLETMWMNRNLLTGSIPEELGSLLSYSLRSFDVSFNYLTGSLPEWIAIAPKVGAVIALDHNPFVCPIPEADLYTGATCVAYQITKIQPTCLQSYSLALIWGISAWPQGVTLYCGFTSVNLNPGSTLTSEALLVNPECLSCNTPDLGNNVGPNDYVVNIYLNYPATKITNQSNTIAVLGSSGCPLDPPMNISKIQMKKHKKVKSSSSQFASKYFPCFLFIAMFLLV